jgi:hypothetical protein
MTISERYFETFCREAAIDFKRLSEGDHETADYEIILGGRRAIVEVKELRENEEDKRALRDMQEKGEAQWGSQKPGDRIRKKINSAKRQIQRVAGRKYPGILLLYDARPPLTAGISPYEIRVAMHGFETIDLHPPRVEYGAWHFGMHRFGKGKKFRLGVHSYFSAVGVLREAQTKGQFHVDLYLNAYADYPLPTQELALREDISLYALDSGKGDQFRDWAEIKPN